MNQEKQPEALPDALKIANTCREARIDVDCPLFQSTALADAEYAICKMHTRISELEADRVLEAARTDEEKLRADQMTDQHRMQCNMRQESEDVLDAAKDQIRDLKAQLSAIGAGGVEPLRKREVVSAKLMSETAQALYAKAEAEGEATPDGRMAFIAGVGWAMQELALPVAQPSRECLQQSALVDRIVEIACKCVGHASTTDAMDDDEIKAFVAELIADDVAALQAAPPAPQGEKVYAALPELGTTVINDACWKFIEAMPHQLPGPIFNELKPEVYAAIKHYHASLAAGPAQECDNCFEGKSDLDHSCRKCGGSGAAPAQEHATQLAGQGQEDALDAELVEHVVSSARNAVNASVEVYDDFTIESHLVAALSLALDELDAARAAQGE